MFYSYFVVSRSCNQNSIQNINMYNHNERTSNGRGPSVYVLRNRVYTQGTGGLYHASVVKDKPNSNCTMKFADDSAKMVFENDLTWLGFHALPSSLWPERPNVLLAGNPVMVDGKMELAGRMQVDDGIVGPRSLKLVRSRTHFKRCVERCVSFSCERVKQVNGLASTMQCSVPEPRTEPRSSVLRLHAKLLQKDEDKCGANIPTTPLDQIYNSGDVITSKCVSKSARGKMKTRSKVYNTDNSSIKTDYQNDSVKEIIKTDDEIASSSSSSSLENHITPMFEQNQKDFSRLFDGTELPSETYSDLTSPNLLAAWHPGDWSEFDLSTLSPPVTPRPSLSLDCPPFQTFYDSLPSESTFPIENTQLFEELVSGKRAKRELPKKCRKVYGIENKKLWCTQCRWKKACTRFIS